MSRDKQTEIQHFATDLQNVSAKVSNIIMEETHEFVSQNHQYYSVADFHKAHPKSSCQMKAEFLTELGYAKASSVAEEIFAEIGKVIHKWGALAEQDNSDYAELTELILSDIATSIAELKKKYTEDGE